MTMPDNIFPVISQPGIQRDGTTFDASSYIDGQWCRFYRGRPQKMGGYNKMIGWPTNIPRGMIVIPNTPLFNIYLGDFQSLKYFPADNTTGLAVGPLVDRTPASLTPNPYNQWTFGTMHSSIDNSTTILAFASRNLYAIDQDVESPIFFGDAFSNAPLTETGIYTSGGFVVLYPFLFYFGNNGSVGWTNSNNPTIGPNNPPLGTARVTGSKIVFGLQARGGQNSPAGIFWSLDSVIRVLQVGTPGGPEFAFDTISSESSILSSSGVVEYDGTYYWAGVDRFLFYNGVVQELPNSMSLQFFFDNLNYSQRQKVWATKYTKYGEIWWHYPSGNNLECNRALIYNVREKSWYDTDISRSCGYYEQTFSKPVWADNNIDVVTNEYDIWRHEVGRDQVVGNVHTAINSGFEMSVMSWAADGPGGQNAAKDRLINAYRFEPDFIQSGDMTLIVNGRQYANSIVESSAPYIFNNDSFSPNFKEKIDLREQRRLMTLQFNSSEIGGYYQMGKCLLIPRMGDIRA